MAFTVSSGASHNGVNVNVTYTISWQGHRDRVMQLNRSNVIPRMDEALGEPIYCIIIIVVIMLQI